MLDRIRNAREEREGGFTLIELLIVIVVLGILAAIVVFAVGNATSQSKVSSCQSQYKTIETALESYKAKNGAYPASYTVMNTDGELKTADFKSTSGTSAVDKNGVTYSFNTTSGVITLAGNPVGCP